MQGAFELADGGTLFLDEVGELSVPLQAELLRVIQEGTFKRVGSNTWRKSAFRLVCATNRDLAAEQAQGTFRNDFYYRIAGCTLHLPSLRERAEDILPLFRHFFRQVHPDGQPPELEDAVRDLLVSRDYPGNVRDLRSLVLRIVHRYLGTGFVTVGDIPDDERAGTGRAGRRLVRSRVRGEHPPRPGAGRQARGDHRGCGRRREAALRTVARGHTDQPRYAPARAGWRGYAGIERSVRRVRSTPVTARYAWMYACTSGRQ